MKKIILFLVIMIMLSCSKESNKNNVAQTVISADVNIFLKNANGDDLLESADYAAANYKVYYEINGQKVLYNRPQYDYSKGFIIINENNIHFLKLFLDIGKINAPITNTYIEWSPTQTDKLTTVFRVGDNYTIAEKIFLNGNLVISSNTPAGITGTEITIVK